MCTGESLPAPSFVPEMTGHRHKHSAPWGPVVRFDVCISNDTFSLCFYPHGFGRCSHDR